MGPVAQRVFKTRAVVQPTARSVRLRRRSVGQPLLAELRARFFREGAAAADRDRCLPRQAALVLRRCRDEKDERRTHRRSRAQSRTSSCPDCRSARGRIQSGTRLSLRGDVDRDHARGASGTLRDAARARAGSWPVGRRALRPVLRPLLHGLRVRADRAADRVRPRSGWNAGAGRPAPRGRARGGEVDPRPRRALPRVPGRPSRGGRARANALGHGVDRLDRGRSGRLPVDPRLPRPHALGALRRERRPPRRRDRGADGDQVGGRDRVDP